MTITKFNSKDEAREEGWRLVTASALMPHISFGNHVIRMVDTTPGDYYGGRYEIKVVRNGDELVSLLASSTVDTGGLEDCVFCAFKDKEIEAAIAKGKRWISQRSGKHVFNVSEKPMRTDNEKLYGTQDY
jgi:hypothetical protein